MSMIISPYSNYGDQKRNSAGLMSCPCICNQKDEFEQFEYSCGIQRSRDVSWSVSQSCGKASLRHI